MLQKGKEMERKGAVEIKQVAIDAYVCICSYASFALCSGILKQTFWAQQLLFAS
jgi:hypothetical protein